MKIVGKIIKYTLLTLLILAIAVIVFRVILYSDESVLTELTPNDTLKEAYASLEESRRPYFVQTHDVPYQISEEDGFFSAYGFLWIPSAHQVQIVVRYNQAVRKTISENAKYQDLGVNETTPLFFVLVNGSTGECLSPSSVESGEKWMYHYERLVFDQTDINATDDMWIEMRLSPDGPYLNRLICHYALQADSFSFYKMSSDEKKALMP